MAEHRGFRAVKLFHVTPPWRTHVIMHLSKPTECVTPRATSCKWPLGGGDASVWRH